jgi:hypothetical protein
MNLGAKIRGPRVKSKYVKSKEESFLEARPPGGEYSTENSPKDKTPLKNFGRIPDTATDSTQ